MHMPWHLKTCVKARLRVVHSLTLEVSQLVTPLICGQKGCFGFLCVAQQARCPPRHYALCQSGRARTVAEPWEWELSRLGELLLGFVLSRRPSSSRQRACRLRRLSTSVLAAPTAAFTAPSSTRRQPACADGLLGGTGSVVCTEYPHGRAHRAHGNPAQGPHGPVQSST